MESTTVPREQSHRDELGSCRRASKCMPGMERMWMVVDLLDEQAKPANRQSATVMPISCTAKKPGIPDVLFDSRDYIQMARHVSIMRDYFFKRCCCSSFNKCSMTVSKRCSSSSLSCSICWTTANQCRARSSLFVFVFSSSDS